MFREDYIRDNDRIKPDDDFLARLKDTVSQEDNVVYIGDYRITEVEYNRKNTRLSVKWRKGFVVAACFVFFCTMAFLAERTNLLKNTNQLKTNIESVFRNENSEVASQKETTKEETVISTGYQKKFEKAYKLFQSNNVVIYRIEGMSHLKEDTSHWQEVLQEATKLSHGERDELIGDILGEKYTLSEDKEVFAESEYYIAEFEDGSYVCFLIAEEYIYIQEVSEIQSLAFMK